jgi:tetratricopeptide (TPR) repeat protein
MRAYVFTDKSLTRQAGRFVWLQLDSEKAGNAATTKRLGVQALPTFFVLDPTDEHVAIRWVGGASVAQLEKLLDDGSAAVAASIGAGRHAAGSPAERTLMRADSLYGASAYAEAAKAYEQALAAAPAGWPRYGRAVESLMFALSQTDQSEALVKLARAAYPRLKHTSSAANVAGSGLDAVLELPDTLAQRRSWVAEFEAYCREVLADPSLSLAGDDRSALYIALLDARHDAKDDAGAHHVAEAWALMLEGEAAKARTPDARAVYDSHRLSAYLELGQPERAIPMLEASERDLPSDYNPPARLAIAYRAMKRWSDGLAASDRAFAKAYGPRRLGMYQVRADLYVGLADSTAARRTIASAIAFADSLPPGQRSERTLATLRKRLDGLGGAAAR